jgi:hypothetical protein
MHKDLHFFPGKFFLDHFFPCSLLPLVISAPISLQWEAYYNPYVISEENKTILQLLWQKVHEERLDLLQQVLFKISRGSNQSSRPLAKAS